MKQLKNFLAPLFAALIITIVFCGCEAAAEKYEPTEKFFVNDFANCIDDSDEQTIYSEGANLSKKTGAQVVVVTVNTTGDTDIDEYAITLAQEWGIGDKDKDNGVLLLLAAEDRNVKIEVGSGIEATLTDGKCGRILDKYGVPYFKNDEFSEGLTKVYHALVSEAYIHEGIEPDNYNASAIYEDQDDSDESDEGVFEDIIAVIIIIVIIVLLIVFKRVPFFFFGGHGGFFGGGGGGFSGGGGGFSGGGGGFSGGGAGRSF